MERVIHRGKRLQTAVKLSGAFSKFSRRSVGEIHRNMEPKSSVSAGIKSNITVNVRKAGRVAKRKQYPFSKQHQTEHVWKYYTVWGKKKKST